MSDAVAQTLDDVSLWTEGIYRRAIVLRHQNGVARGAMVDEQHHAAIHFTHDGETITSIHGALLRRPWTTCIDAPDELQQLVGLPLKGFAKRVGLERRLQCNHLFDVLLLLVAQVERQEAERWYAIDIGRDPKGGLFRLVRLRSSSGQQIVWQVDALAMDPAKPELFLTVKDVIVGGDAKLNGIVVANLIHHISSDLPEAEREALLVLRRAIHVAARNRADCVEGDVRAEAFAPPPSCYAYQPSRLAKADYIIGMRRDFTHNPDMVHELRDQLRHQHENEEHD
jgi:hypothetical protein